MYIISDSVFQLEDPDDASIPARGWIGACTRAAPRDRDPRARALRDTSTSTRDSIRMSSYVKSVVNITLTGAKLLVEAAEAKATEMVILDQGCSSFKALLARTSSAKINYRVRTG